MKPKTPRQKEVARLSAMLPPITEKQKKHAEKVFDGERPLKRRVRSKARAYQIVTVFHGWQVVRTFHVEFLEDYMGNPFYIVQEMVQSWMDETGHEEIVARMRRMSCWYSDLFNENTPMELRGNHLTAYGTDPYHVEPYLTWKERKVLPIFKRNGYGRAVYKFEPVSMMKRLLDDPRAETLAKAGRVEFLQLHPHTVRSLWKEIKMVMRHNYKVRDVQLWYDTIRMAQDAGLDSMAPQWCMPKKLKKTHDLLMALIEEKEQRRVQMIATDLDTQYMKFYRKLLDVVVEKDGYCIRPLRNHEEFREEGRRMHNCVETYFSRRNCLVLSARKAGRRVATIELSMDDFQVRQCRSQCNGVPKDYAAIVGILDSNRQRFLKAKK